MNIFDATSGQFPRQTSCGVSTTAELLDLLCLRCIRVVVVSKWLGYFFSLRADVNLTGLYRSLLYIQLRWNMSHIIPRASSLLTDRANIKQAAERHTRTHLKNLLCLSKQKFWNKRTFCFYTECRLLHYERQRHVLGPSIIRPSVVR